MSDKIHAKLNETAAKICQKVKQRSALKEYNRDQMRSKNNPQLAMAINKRMEFYHDCVPTESEIRTRLEESLKRVREHENKKPQAKDKQRLQWRALKDKPESGVSSVTITLNKSFYEKLREPSLAKLNQENHTLKELKRLHKKMMHLRDMVIHNDNELCQAYESLQLQQELGQKLSTDRVNDEIEMLKRFEAEQKRKYKKLKRRHRHLTTLAKHAIDRAVKQEELPNDEYFGKHFQNSNDDYYHARIKHFKMLCFNKELAAAAWKNVSQKKLNPLEFKLSTYKNRPIGKFIAMSANSQRVEV